MKHTSPSDSDELIFDARARLKERNYWLNQLSGDLVKSSFPFDHREKSPGEGAAPSKKNLDFEFSGEMFSRLMGLSNHSDIRLYIILMTGLVLLLAKYTGNRDIIVGSPIYRQESEGDFINKILALRHQLEDDMTFKQLLLQVSKTNAEAIENINYPVETIPYELNMTFSENQFPLFDTAILVENIHDKSYIDPLNPDVTFSFLRTDGTVKGQVEYNADLYRRETMERIISHYINLMRHALFNIETKLSDISILSEEESYQLLVELNNTRTGYPKDRTIQQLFEEQVARAPDNIAVSGAVLSGGPAAKMALTYRELNRKADQLAGVLTHRGVGTETITALLLARSLEVVAAILAVLKAGGAYLPIDTEYPVERINYILRDSDTRLLLTGSGSEWGQKTAFQGMIIQVDEVLAGEGSAVNRGGPQGPGSLSWSHHLAYVIYTSGTTGKPKGVMIQHRAVVNYVCWAAKTYVKNESVNFPLYSSISFDLTVTSLFTPLLTGNTIVVYGKDESERRDFLIEEIIDENRVGVVKLTPSHLHVIKYKALARSDIGCFIVGGEELETRIAREIAGKFAGNAAIYNEYGPTETAVGCVCYKFDPAGDNGRSVPIGVPTDNVRVYILDRNRRPVPKGVSGEIYISGDGVARGYLNSVELTAEKFGRTVIGDSYRSAGSDETLYKGVNERWYRSGDLARWLPGGKMEYVGRGDHQVKIRGYRVELSEIEQQLLGHGDIKEVVVTARDGEGEKGDPYLCAYFVCAGESRSSQLREYLQERLPGYMIPLFFVQLAEIPLTSNGKVDRRKLPEPEIDMEQEYAAPGNETEEKLVAIWSEVLGLDKSLISIDANFFELGGHSLKQVILISMIHKEFNVKIALAEIFKIPTIRGLSKYITDAAEEEYASLQAAEEKEYYALALPQKRFYIFQHLEPESITYNISLALLLEGTLEKEKLAETFRRLIQRHESLRTSFELVNDEPVQRIHRDVDFKIEYTDDMVKNFIRPFNLGQAPLMRVGLVTLADNRYILIVDMHHIITDGVSERIMTEEFITLYAGKELPSLRFQYKDFSEWQNSEEQGARITGQGEFWIKQFAGDIPTLNLLADFPRPEVQSFAGSTVDFEISAEQTRALKELALQEEVSLYMVLLAVYYILLAKLSGQEDIIVGTGVVGRSHADLMGIIGLMFNTIPLRNQVVIEKTFVEFLKDLKTKTIEAFENQEYPFDELVEELLTRKKLTRDASRNPLFDTMFAMQNFRENTEFLPELETPGLKVKPYVFETRVSRFDLFLIGTEANDMILMRLEFSTALFKPATAEKITRYYLEILAQVLENKEMKLEDITIFSSPRRRNLEADVDHGEYMDFSF